MKKLSELGISPSPWSVVEHLLAIMIYDDADGVLFGRDSMRLSMADARLISAAPELFEALADAVESRCQNCRPLIYGDVLQRFCRDECQVARWHAALAKAAGESEDDND